MTLNGDVLRGALYALPWVLLPLLILLRQRSSRSLADYSADVETNELVSVILPARNEAEHIAACVQTLRATTWPSVEIIVVNDHSLDDTRTLAMQASSGDARVRVVDAPDLPTGWFGKQWACHSGAQLATGSLLLFTDADTRHAPDLIARMVNARAERRADLFSVAGSQEMRTFWERAIQPVVFAIILSRYGGTAQMENAKRRIDVIANGQCLMMTREAYDRIGGHESVRATVAEDLMLAQNTFAAGMRVSLVVGLQQLSTRMYDSLGAIAKGWMKNVYAGGRLTMWGGAFGRLIFPVALLSAPLMIAVPFVVAVVALAQLAIGATVSTVLLAWSLVASAALLLFFGTLNTFSKTPAWRVLLVPIGALAFTLICVGAIVRGQSVEWKGRTYQAK